MKQFRYNATSANGKLVKGILEAANKKEAKLLAQKLTLSKKLTLRDLETRSTFLYRIQRPDQEVVKGEQQAFSKDELQQALERLGYTVLKIEKKLFEFKGAVPDEEITSWINLCADLLEENLPYEEILALLYEDTPNKRMKETIKQIQQDLKEGKEGHEVFQKHADVFGEFPAYMLGVAATSGNMRTIYQNTAKFMQRDAEFKRNMQKAIRSPMMTVLAILGVVVYYITNILPETTEMIAKQGKEMSGMVKNTMAISAFLISNWLPLILAIIIPAGILYYFTRTPNGKLFFDKVMIRIPVFGPLMHKSSIEIFARIFSSLYSGSGENIDVIRIAAKACRNTYIEHRINDIAIPIMLGEGKGIVEAMEATGVFPRTAISRFRSGAETGALKSNTLQLANYYEKETGYRMEKVISTIGLFSTFVIGIGMMYITLLSTQAAM